MYHKIKQNLASFIKYSETSAKGWGLSMNSSTSRGNWLLLEQNYHINLRELLAVQLALKSFAGEYRTVTFWLNIDMLWEPPTIIFSIEFLSIYGNGVQNAGFGLSQFTLILFKTELINETCIFKVYRC